MPQDDPALIALLDQGDTRGIHIPDGAFISNYHPLSYAQVKGLIDIAFRHGIEANLATRVHVRLVSAIPGMESPHRIEGPVAKNESELGIAFYNGLVSGDKEGALSKITNILSLPDPALLALVDEECPHEGDMPGDRVVNNYRPLSYQQMKGLVSLAFNNAADDPIIASKVYVRLSAAIPGMLCPIPHGPLEDKDAKLAGVLFRGLESGDEKGAVRKIASILNLTP
jgi:hypothetical protein